MKKELIIMVFLFSSVLTTAQSIFIVNYTNNINYEQCLKDKMIEFGYNVTSSYTMPDSSALVGYDALFLLLYQTHILNIAEGNFIIDYLNQGKSLYVEGVHGWGYVISPDLLNTLGVNPGDSQSSQGFLYGNEGSRYEGINIELSSGSGLENINASNGSVSTFHAIEYATNDTFNIAVERSTSIYRTSSAGFFSTYIDNCDGVEFVQYLSKLTQYLFLTSGVIDDEAPFEKIISVKYYNILGQEIEKPKKGFYIEKKVTNIGVTSNKYFIK